MPLREPDPNLRLEAICNNASVALFIKDRQQHCVYMNPAAEELTGYSLEEVQGRPLHDFIHRLRPDGSPYPVEECPLDRALPEQNREQGEEVFVHKDGHFYPVAFTASPIRRDGEVVGTVLEARDITEQRRTQQALQRSESRFRNLADSLPQLVWEANAEGGVEYYNARAAEYGGIERCPDGRWSWQPAVHPEDIPATEAAWRQAVQTGRPYEIEHRVYMADGRLRWHLSRAVAVRQPSGELRWFGTATDIHNSRLADEALRESEQRYRLIARATNDVIWDWDLATDRVSWNEAVVEQFGLSPAEMGPGVEGWTGRIHPEDRDRVFSGIRAAIEGGGESWGDEYRFRKQDGSYATFLDRGYIGRDAGGRAYRMIGSMLDLTERRRAEEALAAANTRLRESDRRKDEFLAMLAHELRTPLASLTSALQLISRSDLEPAQVERMQALAQRQAGNLARLVDDLLDVSRVTRGAIDLRPEPVDLGEVVERALESVQGLVGEKQHEINVDAAQTTVLADPARLEQVVINLLSNAAKYTPTGGRIGVTVEGRAGQAVLRVRDTGIGLEPELLGRVFELFGQGRRGLARSEGGLGIGLTIVRTLVQMHGGEVEARSEGRGRGSEFVVRLPLAQAPARRPDEGGKISEPAEPRRVLVVDDNTDAADTLALLLRQAGHAVAVAHDGAEALAQAAVIKPQVALLDIGLPGMDGYELAQRLREHPATAGAALAAVSGYGQPEDQARTRAAGFDAHFVKPVNFDRLAQFLGGFEQS